MMDRAANPSLDDALAGSFAESLSAPAATFVLPANAIPHATNATAVMRLGLRAMFPPDDQQRRPPLESKRKADREMPVGLLI
jgi:hypothetical protein